jgi:Dihydrofolate reductase
MTNSTVKLTHILAQSKNGVIGNGNTLPWKSNGDMKHFAKHTKGKVCIMGSNTFHSINPPLKDRFVIVLTRDPDTADAVNLVEQHKACASVATAIQFATQMAGTGDYSDEIMVVGGREVYKQTIPYTNRALISTIDIEVNGDTLFDWEYPENVVVEKFKFKAQSGV